MFTEDPAVVMEGCAVITNPARESRNGEKEEILPAIKKYYSDDQIFFIKCHRNDGRRRCDAGRQAFLCGSQR